MAATGRQTSTTSAASSTAWLSSATVAVANRSASSWDVAAPRGESTTCGGSSVPSQSPTTIAFAIEPTPSTPYVVTRSP